MPGVFAALLAIAIAPIWIVRYHPLPDLANHLAAMAVWTRMDDPAFDVGAYYEVKLGVTPYWGYYAPMRLLVPILGLDVANRVVLSLYAATVPIGFAWLAHRLGRSAWLGLFGFAFIGSFSFNMGFIHTAIGFALLAPAIAAFDLFCERPSLRSGALAAAGGLAVFFSHIVPWTVWVVATGLLALFHEGRQRSELLKRGAVIGSVVVLALAILRVGSGKGAGAAVMRPAFSWDFNIGGLLKNLYHWTWDNCSGREDKIFAFLLAVAFIALWLTAGRGKRSLHDYRAEACFAAALICYLFLPKSVIAPAYSWGLKYRVAAWVLLFLALLVPRAIDGWRRWLLVPVALVSLAQSADAFRHWQRSTELTAGFDEVAQAVPTPARVLFLLGRPYRDASVKQDYVQSWPSFFQAYHGGYNPWLFDDFPLRFRQHLPAPPWQTMAFDWNQHGPHYDYVVTFRRRDDVANHPGVTRVKEAGEWTLWRLPEDLRTKRAMR